MTAPQMDVGAQALWRDYVARIDRMVARLGPDGEEMSQDLQAHLAESFASETEGTDSERLQRAIARLGDPSIYLRPLLADHLLERGTRTYDPALIGRGLFHAMLAGSRRALAAAGFAFGYLTLAILAIMTVLKPFFADSIGLVRGADGSLTFGITDTASGEELLGLWSIPLTLGLCVLLYILLTRLLRRQRRAT